MTSTQSLFTDIMASEKPKVTRGVTDNGKDSSKDKPENELSSVNSAEESRPEKGSSRKTRSSSGRDKKSVSDPSDEDGWSKLGNIMKTGFDNMQRSLTDMGDKISDKIVTELKPGLYDDISEQEDSDDYEYDRDSEITFPGNGDGSELFTNISKGFLTSEPVGPEVNSTLADLVNTMLSVKPIESNMKTRSDAHVRPKNCSFLETPKLNKEIWSCLTKSQRSVDVHLQETQRDLLKSVVPVVKVIEILYNEKDSLASDTFDPLAVIKSLTDSIAFAGSANINLVKRRKESIKTHLPPGFQKLCAGTTPFTGALLFGEDLQKQVKEINELHKFATEMAKKNGTRQSSDFRQSGWSRGDRKGSRNKDSRYARNQYARRYKPYSKTAKPSNTSSPSKKQGGT